MCAVLSLAAYVSTVIIAFAASQLDPLIFSILHTLPSSMFIPGSYIISSTSTTSSCYELGSTAW